MVVVERPGQPVVLRDVVVDAAERIRREIVARDLERRLLQDRIRQVDDGALGARALHVGEELRQHRIERRGLAVLRRQLQQIHRRRAVGVGAGRRRRRQDDAVARDVARTAAVFVVEEEERLVVAVEEAGNHDRAAQVEARLVLPQRALRRLAGLRIGRQVAVVEEGVRVEGVVPQREECVALELVGARLGDEADVDRALAAAVGAVGGGGDGDFLDRVEARLHAREEPVRRLQVVVLDRDAVQRDVDRALRQAVDRRVARRARGVDPRQVDDEVEAVAAGERQALNLFRGDRGRDRGRLGRDDFRAAGHDDLLLDAADFHRHLDARGDAGVDDDVVDGHRLEARERHADGVLAGVQRGHGELPFRVGHRLGGRGGPHVLDDDVGAGNQCARRISHGARQR